MVALISMRKVSKFFDTFQALKDVSLDVNLGEKVVICGPSGSGKSTLIRCINRLEAHEQGEIIVDGVTLTDDKATLEKNPWQRRDGLSAVQFVPSSDSARKLDPRSAARFGIGSEGRRRTCDEIS